MNFGGNDEQIKFYSENNNPIDGNFVKDNFSQNSDPAYSNYNSYNKENYLQNEETNSALHFFLYLISFLLLSSVSIGIGTILYQIINKIFPETEILYSYFDSFTQQSVKFGLASVVIATPAYFAISFLITKYLFEGKILENSKVRKWVTYIILFIASSVILGDLISLVYEWLGGDMVSRFVLKFLVVLFIAGSVFGYYFWDMLKKNVQGVKYLGNKIAGFSALGAILIIFVSSFFIVDSPSLTRDKKIDSSITNDMRDYTYSISSYYRKNKSLPEKLSDLDSSSYLNNKNKDSNITYKKTGQYKYQLCANFKTSNLKENKSEGSYDYGYGYTDEKWKHDKGNKCFDQEISEADKRSSSSDLSYNRLAPPTSSSYAEDDDLMINDFSEEEMRVSQQGAIIASTKSYISSTVPNSIICRDKKGTINSGKGGDPLCTGGDNSTSSLIWPRISNCGTNAEDTKWTVFNGNNDNWTITLNCTNMTSCNGPGNAICDKNGCKFQGSCQ